MRSDRSREEWDGILRDWKQSGKRRIDFCREQNLKVTAFDYWRRKLLTPVNGSENRLVRLSPVNFRPTRAGIIQLKVGQRYTLEFQEDIGAAQLLKVLKILRDVV